MAVTIGKGGGFSYSPKQAVKTQIKTGGSTSYVNVRGGRGGGRVSSTGGTTAPAIETPAPKIETSLPKIAPGGGIVVGGVTYYEQALVPGTGLTSNQLRTGLTPSAIPRGGSEISGTGRIQESFETPTGMNIPISQTLFAGGKPVGYSTSKDSYYLGESGKQYDIQLKTGEQIQVSPTQIASTRIASPVTAEDIRMPGTFVEERVGSFIKKGKVVPITEIYVKDILGGKRKASDEEKMQYLQMKRSSEYATKSYTQEEFAKRTQYGKASAVVEKISDVLQVGSRAIDDIGGRVESYGTFALEKLNIPTTQKYEKEVSLGYQAKGTALSTNKGEFYMPTTRIVGDVETLPGAVVKAGAYAPIVTATILAPELTAGVMATGGFGRLISPRTITTGEKVSALADELAWGIPLISKAIPKGKITAVVTAIDDIKTVEPKIIAGVPEVRLTETIMGDTLAEYKYPLAGAGISETPGSITKVYYSSPLRQTSQKFLSKVGINIADKKLIYEGIPGTIERKAGRKKALDLLSDAGLSEKQSRDLLRLRKPSVSKTEFKGTATALSGLTGEPIVSVAGKFVSKKIVQDIPSVVKEVKKVGIKAGDVDFVLEKDITLQTKGGRVKEVQYARGGGMQVMEKDGVNVYASVSDTTKGIKQAGSGEFMRLKQKKTPTVRRKVKYGEMDFVAEKGGEISIKEKSLDISAVKEIEPVELSFKTSAEGVYIPKSFTQYKVGSAVRRIFPTKQRGFSEQTMKLLFEQGEPKSIISESAPFRVIKAKPEITPIKPKPSVAKEQPAITFEEIPSEVKKPIVEPPKPSTPREQLLQKAEVSKKYIEKSIAGNVPKIKTKPQRNILKEMDRMEKGFSEGEFKMTGVDNMMKGLTGVSLQVGSRLKVREDEMIAEGFKESEMEKSITRLTEAPKEKERQKLRSALSEVQGQKENQKLKQDFSRFSSKYEQPPKIKAPEIKPIDFLLRLDYDKRKKKNKKKPGIFKTEIRRRGKWFEIGEYSTPQLARVSGERATLTTLGASFRVTKERKPVQLNIYDGLFRPAKREKGVVVQRLGKRLMSFGEVTEIQRARKYKELIA